VSILSDKQIRARSMVPTHYLPGASHRNYEYVVTSDKIYEFATGGEFQVAGVHRQKWLEKMKPIPPETIVAICKQTPRMITPFEPDQVRVRQRKMEPLLETYIGSVTLPLEEKLISYGTSSYGYDVRCADEFKIFTNINSTVVDPKNFDDKSFVDFKGDVCIIPPNSFALARTLERMVIPRDILTVCLGKSTYARCGIIVNVTPFEPEWEGYVTLEFSNTTPLPAKIYANEGVAQILFLQAADTCETSYKDRGGKYQNQNAEVVCPKV
jgi:dCTP deaminase